MNFVSHNKNNINIFHKEIIYNNLSYKTLFTPTNRVTL